MTPIERINHMMNLEPDRYKRMSMSAILRDTQSKLEAMLKSKREE
jgi:hypothetical protein